MATHESTRAAGGNQADGNGQTMLQLLDALRDSIGAVAADRALPSRAAPIKQHAQDFAERRLPAMQLAFERMRSFAQAFPQRESDLAQRLDDLRQRQGEAREHLGRALAALDGELAHMVDAGGRAAAALDEYQRCLIDDQRSLEAIEKDLGKQAQQRRQALGQRKRQLQTLMRRINNPIGYIGEALQRLFTQKRSVEAEIHTLQVAIADLNRAWSDARMSLQRVHRLAADLALVETAAQNGFNAMHIGLGKLEEVQSTLGKADDAELVVMIEAYLRTLAVQVDSLN